MPAAPLSLFPWRWLSLLGGVAMGCATAAPSSSAEAELQRTVERLRAQNAAYARQIEELENQVFILSDKVDSQTVRRAQVAVPRLPEVKLQRGQSAPQPDAPEEGPPSLVEDAEIEYAGEAQRQHDPKRPVLRLYGQEEPGPAPALPETPRARAPANIVVVGEGGAPPSAARASGPRPPEGRASALYNEALAHLRAGRHEEAAAGFREFVRRHPGHDYADNAQYWLGECSYDRKDFSTAVREFRRVVERFPNGNKAPDALLKMGFSYLGLGSHLPGRQTLEELVRTYPRHSAASLAAAKLAELDRAALSPRTEER